MGDDMQSSLSSSSFTIESLEKKIKLYHNCIQKEKERNIVEICKEMHIFLKKKYPHIQKFNYTGQTMKLRLQKGNRNIMIEYIPKCNHIYIYCEGFKIISIENGEKEDYADAYLRLLDNEDFVRYKLSKKIYQICNGQIGTIKNIVRVLNRKKAEFERTPIRQNKQNAFLILSKWRDSNMKELNKDLIKIICANVIKL